MSTAATRVVPRIVVERVAVVPTNAPKTRRPWYVARYSARFVGGRYDGRAVEGGLSPEHAIGALIREVAVSLGSVDAVLEFIAGLFCDLSVRSVNVALARAVWLSVENPKRKNPGVRIESKTQPASDARKPRVRKPR